MGPHVLEIPCTVSGEGREGTGWDGTRALSPAPVVAVFVVFVVLVILVVLLEILERGKMDSIRVPVPIQANTAGLETFYRDGLKNPQIARIFQAS